MKKRLLTYALTLLTALAVGVANAEPEALASTAPYKGACSVQGASSSAVCLENGSNPLVGPGGTLGKVVTALGIVGGIVAVIFLIVGGIKYIFSQGDSAATASAKNTIIYALVGLIVTILAQQLISFVLNRL